MAEPTVNWLLTRARPIAQGGSQSAGLDRTCIQIPHLSLIEVFDDNRDSCHVGLSLHALLAKQCHRKRPMRLGSAVPPLWPRVDCSRRHPAANRIGGRSFAQPGQTVALWATLSRFASERSRTEGTCQTSVLLPAQSTRFFRLPCGVDSFEADCPNYRRGAVDRFNCTGIVADVYVVRAKRGEKRAARVSLVAIMGRADRDSHCFACSHAVHRPVDFAFFARTDGRQDVDVDPHREPEWTTARLRSGGCASHLASAPSFMHSLLRPARSSVWLGQRASVHPRLDIRHAHRLGLCLIASNYGLVRSAIALPAFPSPASE